MPASITPALLFVATDVDPAHEDQWNRWYDTRHVPQRQAMPGFLSARRYELAPTGRTDQVSRKYLALYDIESPDVLKSDAYKALSQPPIVSDEDREMLSYFRDNMRGVMTQISEATAAGVGASPEAVLLNVVALEPEPGYEEEYDAWYEEEHIPFIIKVPGILRVRRFRAVEGVPSYVTIWEHANLEVRGTEAFAKAAETPWTFLMRHHCNRRLTAMYRPLVPVPAGAAPRSA
jgi:antibiotic biosynthesis monooxygenase (ABM) superfamily enzyme